MKITNQHWCANCSTITPIYWSSLGHLPNINQEPEKNRSAHRLSRNPSCVRQDFDGAVDVDFDNNTTQSGAADVLFFPSNWLETGLFGIGVHQPLTFNLINQLMSLNHSTRLSIVELGELMSDSDLARQWTFRHISEGLQLAASQCVAIGCQWENDWKPRLNPKKDVLRLWSKGDKLILIREIHESEKNICSDSLRSLEGLGKGIINRWQMDSQPNTPKDAPKLGNK